MKYIMILVALIFASATASAKHGPCHDDREKHCKGVVQGEGRIHACMEQHAAELSPACTAWRAKRPALMAELKADCKADADEFCADATGNMKKCLKDNKEKLSAGCKEELAEFFKERKSVQ